MLVLKNKKRICISVFVCMVTTMVLASGARCSDDITSKVRDSLKQLNLTKGNPDLCVLTDASYVRIGNDTTEKYLDLLQDETGCSMGKGNLLLFHRPGQYPLVIALLNRKTWDCVVIRYDGQRAQLERFQMGKDVIATQGFWSRAADGVAGQDAYGIVTILGAWASGAPYDFLKCAEYHDHICPGLTYGYFVARGIEEKFPPRAGEQRVFIASPVTCKDDAIQSVLNLTAGKKGLVTRQLSAQQMKAIPEEKLAGILVDWNKEKKTGRGIIVGFDLDKIQGIVNMDKEMRRGPKVVAVLELMRHLNRAADFMVVQREFSVTEQIFERLTTSDVSPYEIVGGIEKTPKGQ